MSFAIDTHDKAGDLIEMIQYKLFEQTKRCTILKVTSFGQYSELKGSLIHYDGAALEWLKVNEPYLWGKIQTAVKKDFSEKLNVLGVGVA